ncbi:hypothetical protein [Lactiplantibacillus pentosus]
MASASAAKADQPAVKRKDWWLPREGTQATNHKQAKIERLIV